MTKQRSEAYYDLQLKARAMREIQNLIPEGIRGNKTKIVIQHLNEAWRCYKANIPWSVPGMPTEIESLINHFVIMKGDWWT